jgi:ABC-type transporter Mla subunit MlaD
VNAVLAELGLTETRVSDALRRLAGSGTNLATALDLSNRAWDENTALLAEAERRYGTTAAQTAIARNQVNDFAIDIGNGLLPVVRDVVGTLSAMLEVLRGLPAPVKTALGIVAGLTAAVLLMGGAYLLAVPRIMAAKTALDTWAASAARGAAAARGMSAGLGFLAGPWGLAIAAAATIATVAFGAFAKQQAETAARSKEVADTLDEMTGAFTDATRALIAHKLEEHGALEAAQRLGVSLSDLVDIVLAGGDGFAALRAAIEESTDGAIQFSESGHIAKGSTSDLAVDVLRLNSALEALNPEVAAGVAQWQRTNEATGDAGERMRELDPAARDLATAFDVSATAAEDVADAVDDLDKELKQLFDRVFGLSNAEDDLADAFDALTEKIQEQRDAGVEGAGSLEGMTEAARENRDLSQDLLEKYGAVALETIKMTGSQEEAEAVAKRFKERLEELAAETGTNVTELEGYNDVVAEIERLIEITFGTKGVTAAEEAAERIRRKLANIDRFIDIHFNVTGQAPVGSIKGPGQQHGGEIGGTFTGTDRRLIAATTGEFMVRRGVAQAPGNLAALRAFNVTGRWPVTAVRGSASGGSAGATPGHAQAGGGQFTGQLFLDSGQLLGIVRGEIRQGISEHDRGVNRRLAAGAGRSP